MAQYRTRAGVLIEMKDDAARAVGYEPVQAEVQAEEKPRRRRGKAAEKAASDENDD